MKKVCYQTRHVFIQRAYKLIQQTISQLICVTKHNLNKLNKQTQRSIELMLTY